MPIDRNATLKTAEKLLRQGKLEGAIQEYVRLVDEQPRDWNAMNALGDLYARAGQAERAVAQFTRIADHLHDEGFFPKAGALYKKALKILGDHEPSLLRLGEMAARQGLVADAKLYFGQLGRLRRARGDERGANECLVALGALPDPGLKLAAGRAARVLGETARAGDLFLEAAEEFEKQGRGGEALDALGEAAQTDQADAMLRARVAGLCLAAGDLTRARRFLSRESAGDDPDLLLALGNMELADGRPDEARLVFSRLLVVAPHRFADVMHIADDLMRAGNTDLAFGCVDAVSETALLGGDVEGAIRALEALLRHGAHIPALMKLVEVAVDAGRDDLMTDAQQRLADAYLEADRGAEARVVAEDLVARDPRRTEHVDRLRRALIQVGAPDVESIIARHTEPQIAFEDAMPDGAHDEAPLDALDIPGLDMPETFTPPTAAPLRESEARYDVAERSGDQDEEVGLEVIEVDLSEMLAELSSGSRVFTPSPATRREPHAAPAEPPPPAPPKDAVVQAPGPRDLEGVFEQMRARHVREHQGTAPAAQLERGLQHLEHGRVSDAIADLQAAARAPMLRFVAASALGRLYASQGDLGSSVEWLERAAEAPAPSEGESLAVLYELADTLERMGEPARALAVLLVIDADREAYRDVSARIEQLSRAQAGSHGP